jgi:hypothetical protein
MLKVCGVVELDFNRPVFVLLDFTACKLLNPYTGDIQDIGLPVL